MSTHFGPNSQLPAGISQVFQQNYLERAFINPLLNELVYRQVSTKESFPNKIGDTITKTRVGLMIPNTTPLNPAANNNLDNGMTAQQYTTEQYTLAIYQYPQLAPDINLMDDETSISNFAMRNSMNLGVCQATAIDRVARATLFNSYMSGNTVVTVTLGSPGTTVNVDDTRGFQNVVVSGTVTPISVSNPLPVLINGVQYLVSGFSNDATNVSSALITGGTSGTITTTTNVSTTNGTAGRSVVGVYAPLIVRPNGRATTAAIQSTDLLTMTTIFDAVAYLRNNAVPMVDGAYNLYLNATSMKQLFQDPEFQQLTRGTSTTNPTYKNAWISDKFLDVRWIQTTETYVQPAQSSAPVPVAQTIQRPLLCGGGALVEGMFDKGVEAVRNMADSGVGKMLYTPSVINILGDKFTKEGFYFYLRSPLDRLGQIISMVSNYVGGFTVPTDVTTTSLIIPTASNAYYKRAVIIETA